MVKCLLIYPVEILANEFFVKSLKEQIIKRMILLTTIYGHILNLLKKINLLISDSKIQKMRLLLMRVFKSVMTLQVCEGPFLSVVKNTARFT